jgi:thiosulfate/3-mercaptopyruvate sulfurtransferase
MKAYILIIAVLFLFFNAQANLISDEEIDNPILVTTDWLEENLNEPSIIILHIGQKDPYEEEHIPGSRLISISGLITNTENLAHEFPSIATMDSIFKSYGVNKNSQVIISYENDMMIPLATRLYLTLDYIGLGNNTSILNGGITQWQNENKIVTDEPVKITEGNFSAQMQEEVLVNAKWILNNLDNPNVALIDARPEEEYEGREEDSERPRPGHIKGAVNIQFFDLTDEDNPFQFKEKDVLKKMFEVDGVGSVGTIVIYCGTGIWACNVYVIAKYLGYDVRFYDGSYEEWSKNEDLPITAPVNLDQINH